MPERTAEYADIKRWAQELANREQVEYGIRKHADGGYSYSSAQWYMLNLKRLNITTDDIELVLPAGLDDGPTTWPTVFDKWDNYDPTPSGESA